MLPGCSCSCTRPATVSQTRAAKYLHYMQRRSGPRARSGVRRGRADIQSARGEPRSPNSPSGLSSATVEILLLPRRYALLLR